MHPDTHPSISAASNLLSFHISLQSADTFEPPEEAFGLTHTIF